MPSILLSDNGVSSGSAGLKSTAASDGSLALQTTTAGGSATTAVTIDTSQNVGVGVTPSAWSGFTALQIQNGALFTDSTSFRSIMNGYYNGSNWIYSTTNAATRYEQLNGIHRWFNAASGTAGNAISFTQAMTLDASGNLGIGTTSPSDRFDVQFATGSGRVKMGVVAGNNVKIYNTSGDISLLSSDASSDVYLDSQRNVFFKTGNSERARINSSGQLLVGATSIPVSYGGTKFYVAQTSIADYSASFDSTFSTAGNNYGVNVRYTAAAPNGTTNEFFVASDNVAIRFQVRSNGGIANYSANNVNLSDRREKINFAPAGDYLAKICAIPVQTYNYIDQNIEEDDGLTLGVVAQDVQAVAPELVTESNWGTEEEPKMRLSIYQTDLQYALMKCIQEQQAIIEQLKARLDAANL